MAERPEADRVRYRFGPLERRGLIAGWRGGQIASVATGLVLGVLALRSTPSAGGVLGAMTCVGIAVAVACWPIGGRTGEQWLPLVVRWLLAATRGRVQLNDAPRAGHLVRSDHAGDEGSSCSVEAFRARGRPGARLTGVLDGVHIGGVPTGPGPGDARVGAVFDERARTVTAVLAVRGHNFALAGPRDQDGRITGWARVLASMAREGCGVHRVQWIESCLPDDGSGVRTYLAAHALLPAASEPCQSYVSLLDHSSPVTRRHQVLIAVSIHRGHSSRAIRAAGGGEAGAGAVLLRETVALQQQLAEADVTVEGILGPAALSAVLRGATAPMAAVRDPVAPGHQATGTNLGKPSPRRHGRHGRDDDTSHSPWPSAVDPRWDAVRTDGTWHATYWIAEWPRVDVTPDFLGPILFSPARRSLALVMEPVSPSRAARQVAKARTADIADGELRRRGGFLVTARQTREREGAEHRDAELADGHAQYRFSGYVTVTADTSGELREACTAIEQAAGQARLELRLLYGEQDVAFTCTLPIGRGLS